MAEDSRAQHVLLVTSKGVRMSQSQAMAAVTSEVDWRSERLHGGRGGMSRRWRKKREKEVGGDSFSIGGGTGPPHQPEPKH